MKTRRLLVPVVAIACALVMVACGNSEGTPKALGVFESLAASHSAGSRAGGFYESLAEAMPQVRYIVNDGKNVSVADAYVVGDFVSVEPGRSFRWTDDTGREVRHELDFNAEDAMASTVHVTLRIKRSIIDRDEPESVQRKLAVGNTVTLGLGLGAPVEIKDIRDTFEGQTLVALLYEPSPVFDYDPTLWAILEGGAFLGRASADDRTATFPALEPDKQSTFSFEELERPSGEPIRVSYDANSGEVERHPPPGPDDVPASTPPTGQSGQPSGPG